MNVLVVLVIILGGLFGGFLKYLEIVIPAAHWAIGCITGALAVIVALLD